MITTEEFLRALDSWHLEHKSTYPWRTTTNPYHILVALTMLQIAPAAKVEKQYYPKFISRFPEINDLAQAKWSQVFPLWHGIGAYSKGKNILKIAKIISNDFSGNFPETKELLETLPGVTPLISKALGVAAWDIPLALLDPSTEKLIKLLWSESIPSEKAQELALQSKSPREFNNALRDLCSHLKNGKTIDGELGIMISEDIKNKFHTPAPHSKPVAKKAKKSRKKFRIEVGAACIFHNGQYLVQTRPKGKSFVGQWEFPGGKREKGETFEECVIREIREEIGVEIKVKEAFCEILQEFERTDLLLKFHLCDLISGDPVGKEGQELRWISPKKLNGISFLATNAKCIEKLQARHQ